MNWWKRALCATVALVLFPAVARAETGGAVRAGPEIAVAVLAHGVRKPFRGAPPPGYAIYAGEEERGTADIQRVYRTAPRARALKPRLQLNRWPHRLRRHRRGVAPAHPPRPGVRPDRHRPHPPRRLSLHAEPFALGEAMRRCAIYERRTGFGSRVPFNPNLSLGVRVSARCAVEAAFEHFSHRDLFWRQNAGINAIGLRLVHGLKGR